MRLKLTISLAVAGLALGSLTGQERLLVVRVGHFPNLTHAQALVGRAQGRFERAVSPARIDWKLFNAGPSAIEGLFAGELDLIYIGPGPTINAYVRSRGEALRVIAGATSGGAALVVLADTGIQKPEDFHGKRIASPQLGNTQDLALRAWLDRHGLKVREKGGDVQVIPIPNSDQLTLFARKQIDAAWAPEPWAARLIHEANGRLFLDERDLWPGRRFVSTHLVASVMFLSRHRDLVRRWLRTHVELTNWINNNPGEARRILNAEIRAETGMALREVVLNDAFSRQQVTYDPVRSSLLTQAGWAFDLGHLGRERPDLSGVFELSILNEVLRELKLQPVE